MKTFSTIIEEVWGLFVDDGTLAVEIILWLLLAGLILGLMENIWRVAKK